MCGRYVSKSAAAEERFWQIGRHDLPQPLLDYYNASPGQDLPVIRRSSEGERVLELRHWWFVPHHAAGVPLADKNGKRYSTFNATVERMPTSPIFRGAWRREQRCVVPVSGFFEWQALPDKGGKQPWYIRLSDTDTFGLAGLWEHSPREDGTALASFTIVTVPANPLMARIHNTRRRMPAILTRDTASVWLEGSPEDALALAAPFDQALMAAYPVSAYVNNARNQGPRTIEPSAA